jgi:hypothetical protein
MKHSLRTFMAVAASGLVLAATTGRADITLVTNETTFEAIANDRVLWDQSGAFTAGESLPNPFSAVSTNGIDLVESQAGGNAVIGKSDVLNPLPIGEYYVNNQSGGDVTLAFDPALAGFGLNLEDGSHGACGYTITAYNITATATNLLGGFSVTNHAGSHLTFIGVQDTAAEITTIVLHDSSDYFFQRHLDLGTQPILAIAGSGGGNFELSWPTNASGFHVQCTTNLSPPGVWQALSRPTTGCIINRSPARKAAPHFSGCPPAARESAYQR